MASSSYNQTPLSLTPTSPPTLWDVFLSFRGTDTRYTFTEHLYKALQRTGIRTFMDQSDLQGGEVISDSLIQAITESKTYIVVLSENYASSSWCLDELVEILDCYKQMKRLVVPVFYNIDPSVVRHQIGSFKEAFEKHQTRFAMEKVNRWCIALNEVAEFSGYHISQNRSQADIIDEIVDRVLLEINPMAMNVAKYPVGLDSRVEGLTALLKSNTEGVIRIGIHGMGGVGKTTLAKAVYNQNYQQFQGSCFLTNVREVSKTEQGLVCLQEQLIVDVLKLNSIKIRSVDQGIELIKARICTKKVLIVIDDLDNPKPLEFLGGSFALGSIIIITTRNEDLLDSIEVKAKYKVTELDADQSRQLFAQHAFGDYKISEKFIELSKDILKRAGGLPLALTVFGSNLLNQPEQEWRWFIDKLNRVPVDDIEKKLLISFDALKSIDPMLQDIFLDIACFYIGREKEEVVKVIETFYTFVNHNIDILTKRCLLTINDRDEFGMHDLLRDMGREIARNNLHDEPGKHSRLWVSKDIHTVLKNHKGTKVIQGIISSDYHYENALDEGESFAAETFKRMSKLKFLYLNNVILTGSFKHTFEDLRWFRWNHFPLKCLPSEFYAQKLVTLELPHGQMRTMWELDMVSQVFDNLETLNISSCQKLTTTPDFTRFPCLETLNLAGCSSLEEVHISIGSLVSLNSLDMRECINLRSLPDCICSLGALEVLKISGCSRMDALPTNLGNIESLKLLHASGLRVSKLPDSIGRLSNLVELDLSRSKNLETLPDSICNLRSLEILDISDCEKLQELPDMLGMITRLRKLNLECADRLEMLPDISQLLNIEDLKLTDCYHLLSISKLPPNLKRLEAENCRSMERLPNLSNLKQLEVLNLQGCNDLTEILGLEGLTSLENLSFYNCWHLLSIPELPPNLKKLTAYRCRSMERFPNLSNLKHLEILELTKCSALTEILGLEELASLERVNLWNCGNLLSISQLPPNLNSLKLCGFSSLGRLPNLSNLKQLKQLYLTGCTGLTKILGLEELASLRELDLRGCCNSTLLTKHLFQIWSRFEHTIQIYLSLADFPELISQTRNSGPIFSFDLPSNASHNFLAMILCFQMNFRNFRTHKIRFYVKNVISGFTWSDTFWNGSLTGPVIVIVPSSIFSIGSDDLFEITIHEGTIMGIHLMSALGITRIDEYASSDCDSSDCESSTDNVEDEIDHPSKRLKQMETDN